MTTTQHTKITRKKNRQHFKTMRLVGGGVSFPRNHNNLPFPNCGVRQSNTKMGYSPQRDGKKIFFSLWVLVTVLLGGSLQVIVNLLLYSNLNLSKEVTLESFRNEITSLKEQVKELQTERKELGSNGFDDDDDDEFYAFTIRDARRLVPVQIPYGFHVYDYVDVHSSTGQSQENSTHSQLFVDGYPTTTTTTGGDSRSNENNNNIPFPVPPCQEYSLICYMHKIFQVFELVLQESSPTVSHFFFMEADNELCIPLVKLKELALQENRYFLGTGIGFSGWIMSRHFVQDFLMEYKFHRKFLEPDIVAANMLMERHAWAVTRQYLVSHTTLSSNGATALTMTKTDKGQWSKHLPRCMEPHRGRSLTGSDGSTSKTVESYGGGGGDNVGDDHGWDYFDYDECPDSDIYPCHERTTRSGVRVMSNQNHVKKNNNLRAESATGKQ